MSTNSSSIPMNDCGISKPRALVSLSENQKRWQWINNNDFYAALPAPYYSFYNNWVRLWLYWADGYVPWIHGTSNGLLSTNIGTMIVDRATDCVFGGNLMFANTRKPKTVVERDGKTIGKALDFISNKWAYDVDLKSKIKLAIKYAFAGGFSLLKINMHAGELWIDALRADRFYVAKTSKDEITKCVSILNFYEDTTDKKNGKRYMLIEERYYAEIGIMGINGKRFPAVEYKIYDTSVPIQYLSGAHDSCTRWEQLPKCVKEAFKSDYSFRLNEPQAMNGLNDLGVYLLKGSDTIQNVPQVGLGESILANVLNYLYEFDFYNTCFNTDMYLARGRVLIPKYMQSPKVANNAAANVGLDDFAYTKIESPNPDAQKPEPIQFQLRSQEWKEARNTLLENIATNIGFSVSTIASYLNDGSNRTAREVSAEESATTLFIENNRRRLEEPINKMLKQVLRFYGYIDDVEVRWSRAGMTNQTVLVDTLTKAVQAGLISRKKAHAAYNYDDDEEQNNEDYALVEQEEKNRSFGQDMFNDSNYFGDEINEDGDGEDKQGGSAM